MRLKLINGNFITDSSLDLHSLDRLDLLLNVSQHTENMLRYFQDTGRDKTQLIGKVLIGHSIILV